MCLERLEIFECEFWNDEALTLVWRLGNLRELTIDYCDFDTFPESFGNLTNLIKLDLRFCIELKKLPESFGNLTKLQWLSLAECHNLELPPDSFAQLTSLRELHVGACKWGKCSSSCQIVKPGMGAILFKGVEIPNGLSDSGFDTSRGWTSLDDQAESLT